MPKARATTALIWNYFDVSDLADKKAVCKYCKNIFSYKSTITNLKLHIKKKHIGVYEEYVRMEHRTLTTNSGNVNISAQVLHDGLVAGDGGEEVGSDRGGGALHGKPTNSATRVDNEAVPSTSSSVAVTESVTVGGASSSAPYVQIPPRHRQKQQRMVSSYIPRKLGPSEKAHIDKCLLRLITIDLQPFSVVENEGFKKYTHALNPNYELPHRKTLANRLLLEEYETRLQLIKQLVNDYCMSICVTADCWTSRNLVPYIAITGHFIHTETFEYKSILLKCSALDDSHTGFNLAEELKKVANEWNIINKINFFVTDNASNMLTAAHLLGWDHFGCYVHKLNLIVQEGLNLRSISTTVQKVQKTVAHFKRSAQAKEKLLKYQTNAQDITSGCAKGLIISIPTRWNSTYLMLERFSELQEALRATIPNLRTDLPIIPMEEWQCIDQLIEVLKPFYEVTSIMSAEKYLTASKAVVMTQGLKAIFEQLAGKNFFSSVKDFVHCVKTGITTRFMDLERNEAVGMCTYLDPRFKEHAFSDRDAMATLKCQLINKVAAFFNDDDVVEATKSPEVNTSLSIWTNFDRKVISVQTPRSADEKAMEEVEMYLKEAVIPRTDCPLKWWREHKYIYPSLFTLFVKHCNIMVTSVPCEREFSKAGYIISDRRTRLTSSKVGQIMFLNANGV